MLEAIAASAPTAKPRRGPSATPAAATITVTGCTLGIGREQDAPGGGDPAERGDEREVAGSVASLLEPGEPAGDEGEGGEQRREAAVGRVERGPDDARERRARRKRRGRA